MARNDLLTEIEAGALDPATDLPTLLRKCITLGGQTQTSELRDWATRELKATARRTSYLSTASLRPRSRWTASQGGANVKNQTVDAWLLPDEARDMVNDDVPMRGPIAQIAELYSRPDGARIAPAGSAWLLTLINQRLQGSSHVERIYWAIAP